VNSGRLGWDEHVAMMVKQWISAEFSEASSCSVVFSKLNVWFLLPSC